MRGSGTSEDLLRFGMRSHIRLLAALLLAMVAAALAAAEPFLLRGYYLTLMRMPVMGLPEWKQAIDCFAEDDANVIILWTAGGFRSKKFPVTWEYNRDHANVRHDFVRELIDYAHTKRIRVLLGFTPFGYDGVNRFPFEHPGLKARKADGSPVDQFGIQCWGWNLCPAQPQSQRLMREYISEMVFDFYPNADGLLVESSDYNVCRCGQCGSHYYDREFAFVRWLSDEVWKRNTNALILVYPHYFTGAKVPGFDVMAARQTFDPRWGLFFTPHSAHFDSNLIRQARTTVFSSDAPALGTPERIAESARAAREHGVNGFIPSLEAFSFVATAAEGGEPWLIGRRMQPFGLEALGEGRMPYGALVPRVQRFAFREFSHDPSLGMEAFERRLGREILGPSVSAQSVADLIELQRIWLYESAWWWPSPLLDPESFQIRARRARWPASKIAGYSRDLERLKLIATRYAGASSPGERELGRSAAMVVERWKDRRPDQMPADGR